MKSIPLTSDLVTLVDDEDYRALAVHEWSALRNNRTWYATRRVKTENGWGRIYMHRAIIGNDAPYIDHVDGDGLNNQRYNLRVANASQNQMNARPQSHRKYKGVHPHGKRWQAYIAKNGTQHHLGTFDTEDEAALAYNEAARTLFGEFARLNMIVCEDREPLVFSLPTAA